jgi:CheY-like chemotaxis protein
LTNTAGRRILVVDDDKLTADSLAALLRMSGYDVHARYDGASAVAAAEKLRPNLIILDLAMPVLNGYEACQEIRSQPWSEGIVIIAVTGWGPDSGMPRTEDYGFNAHVVKPVKPGEFTQLLANLLQ